MAKILYLAIDYDENIEKNMLQLLKMVATSLKNGHDGGLSMMARKYFYTFDWSVGESEVALIHESPSIKARGFKHQNEKTS